MLYRCLSDLIRLTSRRSDLEASCIAVPLTAEALEVFDAAVDLVDPCATHVLFYVSANFRLHPRAVRKLQGDRTKPIKV